MSLVILGQSGAVVVRPLLVVVLLSVMLLQSVPGAAAAEPLTAPSPPMNVVVTMTASGVEVTWEAPVYSGGGDVTYRVYRESTLVADALTSTTYLDDAASMSAATSSYTVTAVNEAGESAHMGTCVNLDPPGVVPESCVGLVVDLAIWVIENLPGTT